MTKKKLYLAMIIVGAICASILILYRPSEKTIVTVACTKCVDNECQEETKTDFYTEKYIISKDKIIQYVSNRDGYVAIQDIMQSSFDPGKCQILPKEGFAFMCEQSWTFVTNPVNYQDVTRSYSVSYNGADALIEETRESRTHVGQMNTTNATMRKCKVN